MRPLAEFIMRGRMQAALVAGLSSAIPVLFWLAAAAAALVLLRKGWQDAGNVVIAALVPAFIWALWGDPFVLMTIACSLLLAWRLRQTVSWAGVVLASALLGAVCIVAFRLLFGDGIEMLADKAFELLPMVLGSESYQQLPADELLVMRRLFPEVLAGLMAAMVQLMALLSLVLARYWQSMLYNPGGLRQEFHRIRLPRLVVAALVLVSLAGSTLEMAGLAIVCGMALAFAAVSCVHGLAAKTRFATFWLVAFYLALVLQIQLVMPLLVLLAIADSLFDLRGLSRSNKDTE